MSTHSSITQWLTALEQLDVATQLFLVGLEEPTEATFDLTTLVDRQSICRAVVEGVHGQRSWGDLALKDETQKRHQEMVALGGADELDAQGGERGQDLRH